MMRMLIINSQIQVRLAADQTGKGPAISADAGSDASEIKPINAPNEFCGAISLHRQLCNQCSPDIVLGAPEERAPHPASTAIGANQHPRFERAALSRDPYSRPALLAPQHARLFDDFQSGSAGMASQHRIKLVAPHN